jgi:hypothetical protein
MSKIALLVFCVVFALPLCFTFPLDKKAFFRLQSNVSDIPANAQYTYSQSSGRFQGKAYDGGYIDVVGCSGAQGSCRNNPSCQCKVAIGPLPRATCVDISIAFHYMLTPPCSYTIGPEIVFKGMPSCYELYPDSGDMCGRSGFLIHGGDCTYNPSEGCIVISDPATRHRIQHGTILQVTE